MNEHSIETQLALIHEKLELLLAQRDDHEERIRGLEKVKLWMVAVAGVMGLLGSQVAALFAAK